MANIKYEFILTQVIVILLSALIIYKIIYTNVKNPIGELINATKEVGLGNLDYSLEIKNETEINLLAQSFKTMTENLKNYIHSIKTQSEKIYELENLKKDWQQKNEILLTKNKELKTLNHLSKIINSTLEPEKLFELMTKTIAQLTRIKKFALLFFNERKKQLHLKYYFGFSEKELNLFPLKVSEITSGDSLLEGINKANITLSISDSLSGEEYKTILYFIPLKVKNILIGALCMEEDSFKNLKQNEEMFYILAEQFATAVENSRLYELTKVKAETDVLTEIYNRRFFQQKIRDLVWNAKTFNQKLSLLIIDLDNFKDVNDTYGHIIGDKTLKLIAKFLHKKCRAIDYATRYGGDEFAIILPETNKNEANILASRLQYDFDEIDLQLPDKNIKITLSIGIATFPEDAKNSDTLIDNADMALYNAKIKREATVLYNKKLHLL